MKQVFFALQFRGTASPLPSGNLKARTTARGQVLRTAFEAGGVAGSVEDVGSAAASFESEVQITDGDGALAGARGLITSNFSVDGAGAVIDNHVAQLFLP